MRRGGRLQWPPEHQAEECAGLGVRVHDVALFSDRPRRQLGVAVDSSSAVLT